ncbi:MAG: hypothetical protein AAFR05_12210 [Bacteroidota bacterium]
MFMQNNTRFVLATVLMIGLVFASCSKQEDLAPQSSLESVQSETAFQQHLRESTQRLVAEDLGSGRYHVVGEQGTVVNIDNALVNAAGKRVRGTVEVELIEVYSLADQILHRQQSLADQELLQSGGKVYVQVYQNGEQLRLDGQGDMQLLLPTDNTGEAKENMELYYGEEIGEQVEWQSTGEKVEVVRSQDRSDITTYLIILEEALGWVSVAALYSYPGSNVECIELKVNCTFPCPITPLTSFAALYIPGLMGAVELTQVGPNTFEICGGVDGPFTLGTAPVVFIFAIECGDGMVRTIIAGSVISTSGSHLEIVDCPMAEGMSYAEFYAALGDLL